MTNPMIEKAIDVTICFVSVSELFVFATEEIQLKRASHDMSLFCSTQTGQFTS
jgi:hypothetical protein